MGKTLPTLAASDEVTAQRNASALLPPRIGEVWASQGGVYAGVMPGRDGGADYHLIVGPESDDELTWVSAIKWCREIKVHGLTDLSGGYRNELALCFATVPHLFRQAWYWSCEQHASDRDSAWSQYFSYGDQSCWGKHDRLWARAFRRLPIQSFNHFSPSETESSAS